MNTIASGINFLNSVAVDSAGNLFIGIGDDTANSAIKEIPAAGGYSKTNVLDNALPIRRRACGWMEWGTSTSSTLVMRRSGCCKAGSNYSTVVTLVSYATAPSSPYGIALDGSGNIYTANPSAQGGGVFKLDYADAPALAFATTSVGLTDMVDGTESVVLQNIGNATLNLNDSDAACSELQSGELGTAMRELVDGGGGRVLHGAGVQRLLRRDSGQADGCRHAYGQCAEYGGSDAEGEPLRRGRFECSAASGPDDYGRAEQPERDPCGDIQLYRFAGGRDIPVQPGWRGVLGVRERRELSVADEWDASLWRAQRRMR